MGKVYETNHDLIESVEQLIQDAVQISQTIIVEVIL